MHDTVFNNRAFGLPQVVSTRFRACGYPREHALGAIAAQLGKEEGTIRTHARYGSGARQAPSRQEEQRTRASGADGGLGIAGVVKISPSRTKNRPPATCGAQQKYLSRGAWTMRSAQQAANGRGPPDRVIAQSQAISCTNLIQTAMKLLLSVNSIGKSSVALSKFNVNLYCVHVQPRRPVAVGVSSRGRRVADDLFTAARSLFGRVMRAVLSFLAACTDRLRGCDLGSAEGAPRLRPAPDPLGRRRCLFARIDALWV